MLFQKKKKDELHKGDLHLAQGIYVTQTTMENGHVLWNCVLRSLIVFFLAFGSIGGFLSAFDISFHYVLVIVFFLLMAMYFSFLYTTQKLLYRDIGYIAFFAVFILGISSFRLYANSGLYVVVNRILAVAQSFFNLSGVREYEVQIQNDYLTVAIVAIFLGMVMIIILNIWISSGMSVFWSVCMTFPILLIPIYMKLLPDLSYVLSLCAGYFLVMIFKANGHFSPLSKNQAFRVRGFKKDKIIYTQDATGFSQVMLALLTFSLILVLGLQLVFPVSVFESQFKKDTLREKTADSIGNFLLLGFSSFYNRYPSTGGMSAGRLGGISTVRPDYQTDLVVTYAPFANEAIYLKGYTGGIYGDNQWESIYEVKGDYEDEKDAFIFAEESLKAEANTLWMDSLKPYGAYGKMDVLNVGADTSFLYYPYYTEFDDYNIYNNHLLLDSTQGIGRMQKQEYRFFPKLIWEQELMNQVPAKMDVSKVNAMYLDVPEKNQKVIAKECKKIGLNDAMTEQEIIEAVQNYFEENIPYTLKPGSTPKGEDCINYFLTRNRKGFCAHFASAATLIFRQMGIPARYVEGYAISLETALTADENTEKVYEDYYQGYSEIGRSTVLDVEVTDAMAHAWVEVYVDGFGWKNIEVTPGSNETLDENDFWAMFSSFLSSDDEVDSTKNRNNFGDIQLSRYTWILYVILTVVTLFILMVFVKLMIRKANRYIKCHQKNQQEAVIAMYADLCDMIRICHGEFATCRSHKEQLEFMSTTYQEILRLEEMCEQLEQASFSKRSLEAEALSGLKKEIKEIKKAVWKKENMNHKLRLCKR